nr:unnamed protein product [Callosobruchus chinensis]
MDEGAADTAADSSSPCFEKADFNSLIREAKLACKKNKKIQNIYCPPSPAGMDLMMSLSPGSVIDIAQTLKIVDLKHQYGVTILTQFPTENRTGPQTIDVLSKRISALGATQQGQFLVDCETYTSAPQLGHQRIVHVLHNSEQPATVFSILESGTKTIPLATDGLFDLLMMKMSSFYTSKKQTKADQKDLALKLVIFV